MDEKLEFAKRLRGAMEAAGYEARPGVLATQFNTRYWGRSVTFQAVSRWLRGEAIPAQDKLQVLAEWLKVEPQVLRFGAKVPQAVRDSKKRWDHGVGYVERETFEAFMRLPSAQRKLLRQIIMTFAENFEKPKTAVAKAKT